MGEEGNNDGYRGLNVTVERCVLDDEKIAQVSKIINIFCPCSIARRTLHWKYDFFASPLCKVVFVLFEVKYCFSGEEDNLLIY